VIPGMSKKITPCKFGEKFLKKRSLLYLKVTFSNFKGVKMKALVLIATILSTGAIHVRELIEKVEACSRDRESITTVYVFDDNTVMVNIY
jgi:hypothetical protein